MVCSPEQARLNGSKSKGATSKRGKAVASRNATKHGLLAKHPPLLVTEDLSTFEGIVQGLIDQYQPSSPTEHFLVQQIAMGMVRQHRLWSVEAAIANAEILKAQKAANFPNLIIPGKLSQLIEADDMRDQKLPLKEFFREERETLEELISHFEQDLADEQGMKEDFEEWLAGVGESSGAAHFHKVRTAKVYKVQDQFDRWIAPWYCSEEEQPLPTPEEVVERIQELMTLAKERLTGIDRKLEEIAAIDAGIQQSEITIKSVQQPELYSRYQRDINREIYQAIDRLEAIQQRKNEGSIGSFGQN